MTTSANGRREFKYLISEEKAVGIRDFTRSYLDLNEFSSLCPNLSYRVHTVYLDAEDLRLYKALVTGYRNRYEMRIRYYELSQRHPVYFEIKRWVDDCIVKERGFVKPEAVVGLLEGFLPEVNHLISYSPNSLKAIQDFAQKLEQIGAKPKVHVTYEREAYHNDSDSVRLNLDTHIQAESQSDSELQAGMRNPCDCYGSRVMLELKFTERFPNWFMELVRHFDLEQYDTTKYGAAMQASGFVNA